MNERLLEWARRSLRAAGAVVDDAVRLSFTGSRADLERTVAVQMDAVLLLLVLFVRVLHVLQALVDVTLGHGAYTHPWAATVAAGACVVESLLLAVALIRRRRLTLPPLVADAAFGLVGLGLLSVATSHTQHRTGTIDWMLPYTVLTAVGLGLLVAREHRGPRHDTRERRYDWRGSMVVAVLASGYAVSVALPDLARGETFYDVLTNVCNYPVFYLSAAACSVGLSRRLGVIAQRNEDARRQAAELAERAQWRAVTVDVFGPVLDLLDRAAEMEREDEVPAPLRQEAGRLIGLIDASTPLTERGQLE